MNNRQQYPFKHAAENNNPNIVFKENGKQMIFDNQQRKTYLSVHIDGDEISEGNKCDYLLAKYDCDPEEEYFVELKGSEVSHGIVQLEETIKVVSIEKSKLHKYAFLISANVSPSILTNIQIRTKIFRKKYNAELIIKERRYTHKLY